jgi:hypothetical protein
MSAVAGAIEESNMNLNLRFERLRSRPTEIAIRALWAATYATMLVIVEAAVTGCVVLAVLVAEMLRRELSLAMGFSARQDDLTIHVSWPLLAVIVFLATLSLAASTRRLVVSCRHAA